ncbi:MAG: hypothetical protein ACTSYF_00515, partial [Promethearchaeota archaeon]
AGNQLSLEDILNNLADKKFYLFTIDKGQLKKESLKNAKDFIKNSGRYLFVHDKDGNNGVMKVDLLTKVSDKDGHPLIYDGFKDADGTVIKGVYFRDGNDYLISRIGFDFEHETFKVKDEKWYETDINIQEDKMIVKVEGNDNLEFDLIKEHESPDGSVNIFGKNVKRLPLVFTSTKVVGSGLVCYLEDLELVVFPVKPYKGLYKIDLFLGDNFKDIKMSESIKLRDPEKLPESIKDNFKTGICAVVYQFLRLSGKFQGKNPRLGEGQFQGLYIPDITLNLDNPSTIKYSADVLEDIFNEFLELKSSVKDLDLNKLTFSEIFKDTVRMKDHEVKDFYRMWLKCMQESIRHKGSDSRYYKYRKLLFKDPEHLKMPVQFSNNKDYEEVIVINKKQGVNDFKLIDIINDILTEQMGRVALGFLLMGILTFEESEKRVHFVSLSLEYLTEMIRKMGLKSKHSLLSKSVSSGPKSDRLDLFKHHIFSILLFGFYQDIEVVKYDADKDKPYFGYERLDIEASRAGILDQIFEDLPEIMKGWAWYTYANNEFMNAYFTEFVDEMLRRELITLGRKEILALIWEHVEKYIEDNVPEVYTDKKDQMYWVVRTKGHVASIFKEYIACPSDTFDFIYAFKEAVRLKKDLEINLRVTGGRSYIKSYVKNKLIYKGLEIKIPYDALKNKITYKMIIGMSYKYVAKTDTNKIAMTPAGYAFDMESLIKSLGKKIYQEIDELTNLLKMLPDSNTILVKFYSERGGGLPVDSTLKDSFDYLGFKRNQFTFSIERDKDGKITNMDELRKVANTMALYVKAHPDAVARVLTKFEKGKSHEVYFAYSNKGVLPNSYLLCSDYSEDVRLKSKDFMDNDELYTMYSDGFYEAHENDFKAFLKEHKLDEDTKLTDLSDDLKNEFIQQQLIKAYKAAWNVLGGLLDPRMLDDKNKKIEKPGLYDFTDIWNFPLCSFEDKDGNYHVCSQITDKDHKKKAWLYFQNVVYKKALIPYYKKVYFNNKNVKDKVVLSKIIIEDLTK